MALTIIQRYNLGGGIPYSPSMLREGEMFYRENNANVRRTIFGTSDGLFANVPAAVQETAFPGGRQSLIVNNNYVLCAMTFTGARWFFVDIDSALVTSFVGGTTHRWSGKIFTNGTDVICPGNEHLTTQLYTSKVTPPGIVETITGGTGYVTWERFDDPAVVGKALWFDSSNEANLKHFIAGKEGNFQVVGGQALINTITPQMSGVITAVSGRGPFMDTRPEAIATRKTYNYELLLDKTDSHVYGMMGAHDNAGVFLGVGLWRTPLSVWPDQNSSSQYYYPLAEGYSNTNLAFGGVHINRRFQKLYMFGKNIARRLQHAKIDVWPPTFQTALDVDTTNGTIMGVWTFPPHVFVAKDLGGSFGRQLIKIYDTDLVEDPVIAGGGREEESYIMSILR